MSPDSRLYSYDISDSARQIAGRIRDERFRFLFKSQADFEPSDVDNRLIDFVFFDASHNFDLNVATYGRVSENLSERALLVVHDTGMWHGDLKGLRTPKGHFADDRGSAGYIHQPDERKFVNFVRQNAPDVDQIHLHCTSRFRHGLTVLQRNVGILSV
jgi:hypothetical protein